MHGELPLAVAIPFQHRMSHEWVTTPLVVDVVRSDGDRLKWLIN